ncbi:MAG: DUF2948 family protein [Thermohalobaculum sp.]|nr:DUF2948 family protein [Thermohalobaculum sp.]
MTDDARFEDAPYSDRPLRLRAETAADLAVISSLVQDAVGRSGDIAWLPRKRRLVVLLNRFRWEDAEAARKTGRAFERVRTALTVDGVLGVKARGLSPVERDTVFSLLALDFEPGEGCGGRLVARFAGGAEVAVDLECLDAALADLTRPWEARARHEPGHDA